MASGKFGNFKMPSFGLMRSAPTVADFTTPGITRDLTPGRMHGDPISRTGMQTRPEKFDAFGFKKAEQRWAFQQEAIKNMKDTFPIDHTDMGPEGDTSTYGNPMGEVVGLQPGPEVPNMQKVDYAALGVDPGILSEQWWRKKYGA